MTSWSGFYFKNSDGCCLQHIRYHVMKEYKEREKEEGMGKKKKRREDGRKYVIMNE